MAKQRMTGSWPLEPHMERVRLQMDADPEVLTELDRLQKFSRSRSRVDFVRRALDIYVDLMRIWEEDGEVRLIRKDGVVERLRL